MTNDQRQGTTTPGERHWSVTVERAGEKVVTIEPRMLSGRDLLPGDEEAIEAAARNLLGFIGKAAEVPAPREQIIAGLRARQHMLDSFMGSAHIVSDEGRLMLDAANMLAEAPAQAPVSEAEKLQQRSLERLNRLAKVDPPAHAPCEPPTLRELRARHRDAFVDEGPKVDPPAREAEPPQRPASLSQCQAGQDGDCCHSLCPQLRDGEPLKSGRHCPLPWQRWGADELSQPQRQFDRIAAREVGLPEKSPSQPEPPREAGVACRQELRCGNPQCGHLAHEHDDVSCHVLWNRGFSRCPCTGFVVPQPSAVASDSESELVANWRRSLEAEVADHATTKALVRALVDQGREDSQPSAVAPMVRHRLATYRPEPDAGNDWGKHASPEPTMKVDPGGDWVRYEAVAQRLAMLEAGQYDALRSRDGWKQTAEGLAATARGLTERAEAAEAEVASLREREQQLVKFVIHAQADPKMGTWGFGTLNEVAARIVKDFDTAYQRQQPPAQEKS